MTKTKKTQTRIDSGEVFKRSLDIDKTRADEEARTIEIAFSSESPYTRWFGVEILDHEAQSVRLDRLNNGGAVLVDHDTRDQVGVVESARIDSDRVGRAVIRFSRSARGQEIYNDVLDGIRQKVSVGYRIHKYEVEEREGQDDLVKMLDWEPFEVSIVAVPADESVGVGRSENFEEKNQTEKVIETMTTETTKPEVTADDQARKIEAPNIGKIQEQTRTEERSRVNDIRAMAEHHNCDKLAADAISKGTTVDEFRALVLEEVGKRNNKARAESKHDGDVDLSRNEAQGFSFTRLMEALGNPRDRSAQSRAGFELDVCNEAAKGFGSDFQARGALIPNSVLARDLTAGTATDGAELVASNLMAGSFIDVLRNSMHTAQAGVRMLPGLVGNVQIPRKTSGAAMTWISAEDGDATEDEPQFDQVALSPKDAACFTEVSRRLLQQSTPSIDALVRNDLAQAIGQGLDLAVLYGAGSGGAPEGIANATGINTLDLAAAAPTYAELIQMMRLVMDDNAFVGNANWFIDPNGWEALSTTAKQGSGVEGNFILGDNNKIKGHDVFTTNQVTAEEYFFGDFSQVLVGEWGGLELNVDPYTHSLKGKVRYVVFKSCDIAIRQPGAFCYAHDGITP